MLSQPGSFAWGTWHVLRRVMMSWHFCIGPYIHLPVPAMPHYHVHNFLGHHWAMQLLHPFLQLLVDGPDVLLHLWTQGLDTTCNIFNFHRMWLITKLLLNMRKQHIAAVSSEVLCLWLLTWKYYLMHPFLTDVNIVFLQILWPIDWCACSRYTAHLMLLGIIFRADMSFYDMRGLSGLAISQRPAHFPGTCPRYFINDYNA